MNAWKDWLGRHGLSAAVAFFASLSLGLAVYPSISDWLSSREASQAISSYLENSHEEDRVHTETLWQQARDYNARLDSELFPFDPDPQLHALYEQTLTEPPQTILGVLTIDRIGVRLPVYHGTDDAVLQKGLGHLEGSSLPTGEVSEHTLISGHSGLAGAEMFDHLDQLEKKDRFTLQVLDQCFTYEVCDIQVVRPEDYRSVDRDPQKNLVTLVTCTPYGVNTHRLLVTGQRTDPDPAPVQQNAGGNSGADAQQETAEPQKKPVLIVLLSVCLLLAALAAGRRFRKKASR